MKQYGLQILINSDQRNTFAYLAKHDRLQLMTSYKEFQQLWWFEYSQRKFNVFQFIANEGSLDVPWGTYRQFKYPQRPLQANSTTLITNLKFACTVEHLRSIQNILMGLKLLLSRIHTALIRHKIPNAVNYLHLFQQSWTYPSSGIGGGCSSTILTSSISTSSITCEGETSIGISLFLQ